MVENWLTAPEDRFDPRAGCVLDWKLWRIIVRHYGAIMFAAKRKVGFIAAYLHLIAGRDGFASAVKSHHHCRLLAAMADGPYLAHFISQRQKRGGPRKQLPQKIYSQAISHDGQAKVIDHAGQGPNLFLGQKLRFINKGAGDGTLCQSILYLLKEVILGGKRVRLFANADAGGDFTLSGPCVHLRGEQIGLHAALLVVMRRLQQQSRFAGVHRGVVEIELSHTVMCPERGADARG